MKIETRDMAPEPAPVPEAETEPSNLRLYAKTAVTFLVAFAMLAVLRWAMLTTNDNTRQVSGTLTTLQSRIEQPNANFDPTVGVQYGPMKAHRTGTGPTLEPAAR